MGKGINTIISETENELISLLNEKINIGLPYAVADIILRNVQKQVEDAKNAIIKIEKENELSDSKKDIKPTVEDIKENE